MKKRSAFLAAILSLIPFGSPLFIKTGAVFSTAGIILSVTDKAQADAGTFYYNQGVDKQDAGDDYGAIDDYTKAIEINPIDDSAYHNRAVSWERLGECYMAIADYLRALEIKPDRANSYHGLGYCKSKLGDTQLEEAGKRLGV